MTCQHCSREVLILYVLPRVMVQIGAIRSIKFSRNPIGLCKRCLNRQYHFGVVDGVSVMYLM